MIKVTGFSVERFINLAVHQDVYIWDVAYTQDAVYMKVSAKAFKHLKSCAKKTKCHMKIVSKTGYPFLAHRYRKRKLLLAGLAFFVFTIYGLSLFVWQVDVVGTDRLNPGDIKAFCKEQDMTVGVFKYQLDTKALEQALLVHFPDIVWVNVHIKGTKATVSLKEALPKQVLVDRKTPCHVVAAKDGLVVSVATSAGTPLVKQNDVVHEGDLLVSGELVIKNDETGAVKEYVHADAEVLCKLYYEINFEIPYNYTEKRYTGKTKKHYGLMVLDKRLDWPFYANPYTNFDQSVSRKQLGFGLNYPLPVILVTTTYTEFEPVEKSRTPEQVKELAQRMVTGRIIREFDFSADIIEKNFDFIENNDKMLVKSIITTIESIGRQVLITPSVEEETEDDPGESAS